MASGLQQQITLPDGRTASIRNGYDYVQAEDGTIVQFPRGADMNMVAKKAAAQGVRLSPKAEPALPRAPGFMGQDPSAPAGMLTPPNPGAAWPVNVESAAAAQTPTQPSQTPDFWHGGMARLLNPRPQGPAYIDPGVEADRPLVSAARGAIQGVQNLAEGAGQILTDAGHWAGIVSPEFQASVNTGINRREQAFREQTRDEPFMAEAGRIGGQMLATGLVAPAAGAGVVSRLATNAGFGAGLGAVQPVLEGEPTRGQNIAAGAVSGVILPEIIRGAAGGIGKVASPFMPRSHPLRGMVQTDQAGLPGGRGPTIGDDLTDSAKQALRQSGIEWDTLPADARIKIINDAMSYRGQSLRPEEIARKAIFDTGPNPVNPTKAMLTQTGDDFIAEQNLIRQTGGGMLRDRYTAVPNSVRHSLDDMRVTAGGATEPGVAGKSVATSLEAEDYILKSITDQAYAAVRQDPALANQVKMTPLRDYLVANRSDFLATPETTSLMRGAVDKVKQIMGSKERPMTIDEVETMRKWLNSRMGTNPGYDRLVRNMIEATDESVLRSGNSDVFKEARFAHALRQSTFKDQELVGQLIAKTSRTDRAVPYEDVVQTLIRAPNDSFKQVTNTLEVGQNKMALDDLRASALQMIEDRALQASKTEGGGQNISYAGFKRALDWVGDTKGKILYGDDWKTLRQLQERLRLAQPTKDAINPGSGYPVIEAMQGMMRRFLGGAAGAGAGAMVGVPGAGAAAGAATGDAVGREIGGAFAARKAGKLANNPTAAIESARKQPTMMELMQLGPVSSLTTLDWLRSQGGQ